MPLEPRELPQFPISIAEAKDWFEAHPPTNSLEENQKEIIPVNPLWESALKSNAQSGKEIIIVPLSADSLIKKSTDGRANVMMVISKDTANNVSAQLLMYVADSAYFATQAGTLSLSNFSGVLAFFDLQHNFLDGMVLENGVPVKSVDTVTVSKEGGGAIEERLDNSALSTYCHRVEFVSVECAPDVIFFGSDCCVTNIYIWNQCIPTGTGFGDYDGGGGGNSSGAGGGGGGGGGGFGNGGSSNWYHSLFVNNVPLSIFLASGGTLPNNLNEPFLKDLRCVDERTNLQEWQVNWFLTNNNQGYAKVFCEFLSSNSSDAAEVAVVQMISSLAGHPVNYFQQSAYVSPHIGEMLEFLVEKNNDPLAIEILDGYLSTIELNNGYLNLNQDSFVFPWPTLIAEYALNVAIYRGECPLCSSWELFSTASWRTLSGYVHTALDVCGLIPVGGEPCDLINGVIYVLEGDFRNATLSFSAQIPIAGWFATGAKYAGITVLVGNSQFVLQFKKTAANLIDFGENKLREILQIIDTNIEAHHLIPQGHILHPLTQLAARGNYHIHHPKNGIPLERYRVVDNPGGVHAPHPQYNIKVGLLMNDLMANLDNKYGVGNVPPVVAKDKLIELQDIIRDYINQNPGVKLNELSFAGVQAPSVP
jgi:hypothetical protein